jgi:hypothetical protein
MCHVPFAGSDSLRMFLRFQCVLNLGTGLKCSPLKCIPMKSSPLKSSPFTAVMQFSRVFALCCGPVNFL